MPFFDFHIHPTLKCLFSEDDPANGLTQLSPWVPIDKSKIPLLLRWCTEFPEIIQTQGNLALLSATDTNLVCVALHIPEKAIISDNLITTATNGPLQAYLQAKRIGEIINGNPYLILTTSDLDTLTKATERMTQAEIKLQEAAQKAQSPAGGPPGGDTGGRPSGNPNEKVVDAEFEEVGEGRRSA